MQNLTPEEQTQFSNYYKLTPRDWEVIRDMKNVRGQTIDEIARKFNITPPDVSRILHPPKNYGNWSPEEKLRHWLAGKKRAQTVKRNRELNENSNNRS